MERTELFEKLGIPQTLSPVEMRLVGEDGNAFAILGRFMGAARRQGWDSDSINKVLIEAKSDDYNHLISTMVEVTYDENEDDYEEDYDDED